jgi:pyruvate/2-oxoacid:ferredoxin oxidoreductase beta subunit
MPFCKGCGHTHVLRKLDEAIAALHLDASQVCLVTDIGCIGLADMVFSQPHTVHTTHGRSTAFATGIALADQVMAGAKLKPIVLIGDGGAMIGLLHLVNAALLNVDVTVLLCNNFLFGMTGGQHSGFSPLEFVSQTTPGGNIVPPVDMCRIMADSRAPFVARTTATDPGLAATIAEAIASPGFALVEIVELCTEHAAGKNDLRGNALAEVVAKSGQELGRLTHDESRRPFGAAYAEKFPLVWDKGPKQSEGLPILYHSALSSQVSLIIAGSAGERVQSAARKLCESAVACGLYCTQKNDNPVTQGSGFSLSEVVLSPEEILYTGIEHPTAVIVVSQDGLDELTEKGLWPGLHPDTLVLIDASLPLPETAAELRPHPFRKEAGASRAAIRAIEAYLERSEIFPMDAFRERSAK